MNVKDFPKKKALNHKVTFVTCYDYTSACVVEQSDVEGILVGDSVAMTMYGHPNTLRATPDMMASHVQAVARGAVHTFIVADLPFLSYRKSLESGMQAVECLVQAGAQAVKLEGCDGNTKFIAHVVESGVPVMGHIGLTPQGVHALGGFCVVGRDQEMANRLLEQAVLLEKAGCFAIVLECVPAVLARRITERVQVSTIGIGSGPYTDGQVLVWQDLLGMQKECSIRFVKSYMNGFEMMKNALNAYHCEVQTAVYPDLKKYSYT